MNADVVARPRLDAQSAAAARRLAGLHLRLGSFLVARAELEHLHELGALDAGALADLAEVRWRTGDLAAAARAAIEHIEGGGAQPVARVIAAEAAAAVGRPDEAETHLAALGDLAAADLAGLFAGLPQRAFWPFAPAVSAGPPVASLESAPAASPHAKAGDDHTPESGDLDQAVGSPDPFEAARADLASADLEQRDRGITRLALMLRLDPTLAGRVLEVLARRPEPAALLARGDALRIHGRALEAEAAYAAAGAALERPAGRTGRAGRSTRRPPA